MKCYWVYIQSNKSINKNYFFIFKGERESLITRDREERSQAMYKYQRVEKFRRQQSPLWNALHPTIVNE